MIKKIITDKHTNEENAFIIPSYPYGRLRCIKKVWIETTKRGDRLNEQTQNPKTLKWNKPKKSTYSDVMILYLNEIGHIKSLSWGCAYTNIEDLNKFLERVGDYNFNDLQKKKIEEGKRIYKIRDGIKWEIKARRFKHLPTGNITESINIFELNNYMEIDENNEPINEEEQEKQNNFLNVCEVKNEQ